MNVQNLTGTLASIAIALLTAAAAQGADLRAKPRQTLYLKGGATAEGLYRWQPGGAQPVAAYDFGPATVGGYAVFTVSSFKAAPDGSLPVLRLAYATHPDGLTDKGDFTRETCIGYLRIDNPVLPCNVNRHELYTIPRTGKFVAPLLQGQVRYVRVQLDTPGAEVKVDSLEIVNAGVYSTTAPSGSFAASDPRLKAIWDMSAWTCQIASFPNHDAWKQVDGVLLPRWLEKGDAEGWCRYVPSEKGTLEVTYEFRRNPHFPKGRFTVFTGWLNAKPDVEKVVEQDGPDGVIRTVSVPVMPGRFGFRLAKEEWPMIHRVVVKDAQGREKWRDEFTDANALGKAVNWVYSETGPYIADGAKRDRLVWSGDLWWGVGTVAYAFGPKDPYFPGAIRLLAYNQTPEGYCQAAPFAENRRKPRSGEYGHFASDEFSAWIVPGTWAWYLYSGDRAFIEEVWPAVDRQLAYIAAHTGRDGLFDQRFETSKHAGNMSCGETGRRLYMDLITWMGWRDGARLARALGHTARAAELERLGAAHAAAIRRHYRKADGTWITSLSDPSWISHGAYAMLLASRFLSPEEARALAPTIQRPGAGKMQALLARGLFEYGFSGPALRQIANSTWSVLCDPAWPGAHTTSECLYLVTNGFWDESHPDTAIADAFTGFVLGVRPVEPGFRVFRIAPQMTRDLTFAEGRIPTPHGMIEARWDRADGIAKLAFTVPEGTRAEVVLGGKTASFGPGRHAFSAAVSEADLADPFPDALIGKPTAGVKTFRYITSQPYANHDAVYAHLFDLDRVRGLEKIVLTGKMAAYPDEIEVEAGTERGVFTRIAERKGLAKLDRNAPVAIDVRTAGGPLPARFVRITMRKLPVEGECRALIDRIDFIGAE